MKGLSFLAAALLCATPVTAQTQIAFDSCFATHGDVVAYRAGLAAEGWTEAPDRELALIRIRDALVPFLAPRAVAWAGLDAFRTGPDAIGTLTEIARERAILEADGATLMIGGRVTDEGQRIVECWIAFRDAEPVEAIFARESDVPAVNGVRGLSFAGQPDEIGAVVSLSVVQIAPETEPAVPYASMNGMIVQVVLPAATEPVGSGG